MLVRSAFKGEYRMTDYPSVLFQDELIASCMVIMGHKSNLQFHGNHTAITIHAIAMERCINQAF